MNARRPSAELVRADLAAVTRYQPGTGVVEVDLADNTNRWGTAPSALAELRAAAERGVADYPSLYGEPFKEAIASRHDVDPASLVTGCGSDNVLAATLAAVARAGDRIAYPDPTFVMVKVFAQLEGLSLRPVPLGPGGEVDPEAMVAAGAAVTYLCSPNNPTGGVMGADAILHVIERAAGLVIVDEAYIEFMGGLGGSGGEAAGLLREAPGMGRVVVMRTMSKAWGMAGVRAGYASAAPHLVQAIEKARGPYTLNAVAERAAAAAMTHDVAWMQRTAAEAVVNRERMAEALREAGLTPMASQANFLLVPLADARAVQERLLGLGVRVRAFAALPGIGDALRITAGPWPQCERFLDALAEVR